MAKSHGDIIAGYLCKHAKQKFAAGEVAEAVGLTTKQVTQAVYLMQRAGDKRIRKTKSGNTNLYYCINGKSAPAEKSVPAPIEGDTSIASIAARVIELEQENAAYRNFINQLVFGLEQLGVIE